MTTWLDKLKSDVPIITDDFKNFASSWENITIAQTLNGWVEYVKSIGNTDKELLKFLTDVDSGKRSIKDIDAYIQSASSTTSKFGATLKAIGINLGIMLAINAGIWAVSKAWDHFANRIENLKHAAEKSTQEYSSLHSAIDSINGELKTTGTRIDELNQKDHLTFLEQEELEKLKNANEELERQLGNREALANVAKENANKAAKEYFDSQGTGQRYLGWDMSQVEVGNTRYGQESLDMYYGTQLEVAKQQVADYGNLLQQKTDIENRITDFQTTNPSDYENSDDYQNLVLESNAINNALNMLKNSLSESITNFDKFDDSLDLENDQSYIDDLKAISDGYQKFFGNKKNPPQSFNEIWNSSSFVNSRKELESMAQAGTLSPATLNNNESYNQLLKGTGKTAKETCENIYAYVDSIDKANGATKQVEAKQALSHSEIISAINELSGGFESLNQIMSSISGSDPFDYSLLDDSTFKETFSGLGKSYTDFITTITKSPKDISACQSAFDDLLTSWLNSTGIIEGLSGNTKQLAIDMLSLLGVANAEEIVTEALVQKQNKLAAQKYFTKEASSDLENATLNEINQFLKETEVADITKMYLAQLALEKIAVNDAKIDTASDIEQIIGLANAAGASAKVISDLENAKAVLGSSIADPNSEKYDPQRVRTATDTIESIQAGTYDFEFDIDPNKFKSATYNNRTTSRAGNSGSNSSQATEFDFAAESVKNLKQNLDLLTTDLENTDPYSEKLPILKELIQTQEAYNYALQSQADLYYDEYQKSLQSLPQDLQEKISGYDSFSIETIPDTLKDAVSKAQSYRDKWNSTTISIKQAEKELENLRLKQMDLAQARLDDKIGVVQNKAADIQNQMDEAESMGLNATSKQYKSLIRLSRQEEKYNQNKLTGLQAELLLLDEDEDAYYDCLGAIQDCENAISKCAQNQAAYNKAILELPIQYLEKANDSLNDELDELQDKQDDLDSAIAGVTGHLQDQIEAQQTLRDEAEETAKKQIDAIQNEIDGLQKANDERKQQLDLEEKLYNLERAKNQKTTRIFRESEGGFVYEADSEAVRNAQSEYEDALFEQTISDMEDKIRDIEESRDALLESYDLEIDRLQKIVESWDGITEAIQRAKDMTMAGTILGAGWQDRVTSGDTGDFENVSGQYEKNDREQTWTERQIEENERLIRQVEDYIEAWQMGQITIREAREEINDIVSDVMPEIEANDERVSSLSTYTSAWSNAQVNVADSVAATTAAAANNVDELLATDARRQAVFDYAAEWSNSALAVGGALGSINEANAAAVLTEGTYLGQRLLNLGAFQETYRSMASSISTMCNSIVDSCREAEKAMRELSNAEDRYGYGQGTTHARPGLHRVAEGNRPEIIIRNSGAAFLAKRETHYPFAGGETVLNPSDTRHVLRGDHLEQIDDGLPVLKDQQTRSLIDTLGQHAPLSISGMPEAFSPSAGLTAGNVRQENVVVNFGDVNLPQVKDVDTFTRAIADGTLKSALQQRLMRNK
ncbi:hypothetical protein [Enterocloster lavalensis]|uniref:hypothetical protein n=1 Tax=Enterocloster lavalensis TaxID=460384 RepID=UPI0023F3F24C|nr:hypothetical protein [Enterocloster lavalensis]